MIAQFIMSDFWYVQAFLSDDECNSGSMTQVNAAATGMLAGRARQSTNDILELWKHAAMNPAAMCTSIRDDAKVRHITMFQKWWHVLNVCISGTRAQAIRNAMRKEQNVKSTIVNEAICIQNKRLFMAALWIQSSRRDSTHSNMDMLKHVIYNTIIVVPIGIPWESSIRDHMHTSKELREPQTNLEVG